MGDKGAGGTLINGGYHARPRRAGAPRPRVGATPSPRAQPSAHPRMQCSASPRRGVSSVRVGAGLFSLVSGSDTFLGGSRAADHRGRGAARRGPARARRAPPAREVSCGGASGAPAAGLCTRGAWGWGSGARRAGPAGGPRGRPRSGGARSK
ncbi:MAG: hypothetical protein J3K34DRAFT_251348 [Monoraphidium minutum]|nr:MAG: hypothetical protein J3K34DRAFT_251348 [Monoraphidium minutum]